MLKADNCNGSKLYSFTVSEPENTMSTDTAETNTARGVATMKKLKRTQKNLPLK